jgi:beta-fructofuranosidase
VAAPKITGAFTHAARPSLTIKQQDIAYTDSSAGFPAFDTTTYMLYDRVQGEHMIEATVSGIGAGASFGFVFGMDKALQNSSYYRITFDQAAGQLSGNPITAGSMSTDATVNFPLTPGKSYDIKVVFQGTVCVVYVNDQVALTSRIYSMPSNFWGLFAEKGTVQFDHLQYRSL